MDENLKTSIRLLTTILSTGQNIESLNDLYEISVGNKEIILSHLEALYSIFGKAIKEIKSNENWRGNDKI